MWLMVALLVVWVVFAILGLAIEAIGWLFWLAVILIALTLIFGLLMRFIQGQSQGRPPVRGSGAKRTP
jgi:hypothetical protein